MEHYYPTLVITGAAAFLLYINTFDADFAYDDSRAVQKNPDLLPETPIQNIFYDDFWGTPLVNSGSHKSYRPICVLSFRLNHFFSKLNPWSYHFTNVLLHSLVTVCFTHMSSVFLHRTLPTLIAGILFATHPVHTEAVAGIVGRADVGACLFFILSFLSYRQYIYYRDGYCDGNPKEFSNPETTPRHSKRLLYLFLSAVLATLSMLTKEHGITVLGVCIIYEVFVHQKISPKAFFQIFKQKQYSRLREGLLMLFFCSVGLLFLRFCLMGSKPPEFAPSDNPAADSKSFLTRTLTFHYLLTLNLWLLLCPYILSFDWSMNSIPLVESLGDSRNIVTIAFYCGLLYIAIYILKHISHCTHVTPELHVMQHSLQHNSHNVTHSSKLTKIHRNGTTESHHHPPRVLNGTRGRLKNFAESANHQNMTLTGEDNRSSLDCIIFSLAVIIVPFIPATNLFFYVGFVIAERVLYIPSMGFCMLVAKGAEKLYFHYHSSRMCRIAIVVNVICILVSFTARTFLRNQDWLTEEYLYRSGIDINPAKAWGNLANVLNSQGKEKEAEFAYKNALKYRSNMADVHYNLGILLQDQQRYHEAIESYKTAILCRPKLTMAYLNLGIVYSLLGRNDEAEKSYLNCSNVDITGLRDPRLHESTKISALYNLGRMYADEQKYQLAIETYNKAIQRAPSYYGLQSIYNMLGEAYMKSDDEAKAEFWYQEALRVKPDHLPAHITMAKLLSRRNQLDKAEKWYLKAMALDSTYKTAHQHYAQFLGESGRHADSVLVYKQVLETNSDDFELVFNTANALRQSGNYTEAEDFYQRAAQLNPQVATAHMNLGAILHLNGKLEEAEKSYKEALRLKPNDAMTKDNLAKLQKLMQSQAARVAGRS
ncbi:protein O-mannosyl-transferase TMTC2 [Octopus bimaculoides]|nr:protein O-mannosyl-transferase TMTC2 [Octopus bimaculoides]|eukprot:XP_014784886.1 PREDICTED: transmembrane and TPR repeat-containing protein 2-like [Octopus bimaculoides]